MRLLLRVIGSAIVGGRLVKEMTSRFRARVTVDGDVWARDDFMTVAAACVELGHEPTRIKTERFGPTGG